MNLEKLPHEVVIMILKHVKRKDIYALLFVSKRFHVTVKPIYYRKTKLLNYSLGWLLRQLFSSEKNSPILPGALSLVKSLTVINSPNTPETYVTRYKTEEVLLLLLPFTNLKVLDVRKSIYYHTCIDALGKCNIKQFPQLEEVKTRDHSGTNNLMAYLNFRNSLQRVYFHVPFTNDLSIDWLNALPSFQNLKELTVKNYQYDYDVTLSDILQACPDLSSVDYTTGYWHCIKSRHMRLRNKENPKQVYTLTRSPHSYKI